MVNKTELESTVASLEAIQAQMASAAEEMRLAAALARRAMERMASLAAPDEADESSSTTSNDEAVEDVAEPPATSDEDGEAANQTRIEEIRRRYFGRNTRWGLTHPLPECYQKRYSSLLRQAVRHEVSQHKDWPAYRHQNLQSRSVSELQQGELYTAALSFGISLKDIKAAVDEHWMDELAVRKDDDDKRRAAAAAAAAYARAARAAQTEDVI